MAAIPPPGPPYMMHLVESGWLIKCAHAATTLNIPYTIGDSEMTAAEVAQKLHLSEDHTYRLLRALACGDIFTEVAPRKFKNNANSSVLREGGALRDMILTIHGTSHVKGWSELPTSVKNERSGIQNATGMNMWQYHEKDHSEFTIFNKAMVMINNMWVPAVANTYDWTRFKNVLDLGGGHGGVISHLRKKNPTAQWSVADLPSVCAAAPEKAPKDVLEAGVKFIPTDFFVSVPGGFDAVVMKFILHDWSDESSKKILTNIRKGIPADGIVLCLEIVVHERAVYDPSQIHGRMQPLMDINMMACCEGGRERTTSEWSALASATGFKLGKIVPCHPSLISVIEMIPV